jgi:hypothetical protein
MACQNIKQSLVMQSECASAMPDAVATGVDNTDADDVPSFHEFSDDDVPLASLGLAAQVVRLKAVFERVDAPKEALLSAIAEMRSLGELPSKVLMDTKIGKTMNEVSRATSPLDATVKKEIRQLVKGWRSSHRKRKATFERSLPGCLVPQGTSPPWQTPSHFHGNGQRGVTVGLSPEKTRMQGTSKVHRASYDERTGMTRKRQWLEDKRQRHIRLRSSVISR